MMNGKRRSERGASFASAGRARIPLLWNLGSAALDFVWYSERMFVMTPEMMERISAEREEEDESAEPCGAVDTWSGAVCTKRLHPKSPSHMDDTDWGAVFSWVDVPVVRGSSDELNALTPDHG